MWPYCIRHTSEIIFFPHLALSLGFHGVVLHLVFFFSCPLHLSCLHTEHAAHWLWSQSQPVQTFPLWCISEIVKNSFIVYDKQDFTDVMHNGTVQLTPTENHFTAQRLFSPTESMIFADTAIRNWNSCSSGATNEEIQFLLAVSGPMPTKSSEKHCHLLRSFSFHLWKVFFVCKWDWSNKRIFFSPVPYGWTQGWELNGLNQHNRLRKGTRGIYTVQWGKSTA